MKYAIVNAEYERQLFIPEIGQVDENKFLKIRKNRQYLFYFINQDPTLGLKAYHQPSNQYCDYLESLGLKLPTFAKDVDGFNWYGKLENLELERKLNSKIFSYEFLRDRDELPRDFHFVSHIDEVKKIISHSTHKKWILKSPYMCGGVGAVIINSIDDLPAQLSHQHILEPFLKRKLDFAVHYDPLTDEVLPYVSLIQENGGYRGGRIYANQNNLAEDLAQENLWVAFDRAVQKILRYLNDLKKFPLAQPVTIDGFLYEDESGKIHDYPMCEINYRISMGTFNRSLKRFLPENGVGEFIVFPSKDSIDWTKSCPYSKEEKTGMIMMNDSDPEHAYLLVCAQNRKMLKRMNLLLVQELP